MIVIDANILLYAYDATAVQHKAAATWVEQNLADGQTLAIPWITAWAFVRIATNARTWRSPVTAAQAFDAMRELMAQPGVIAIEPGRRHWELLTGLTLKYNCGGPRLTHAVLAALALEHGALLASADRDFARFKELRWTNPVA